MKRILVLVLCFMLLLGMSACCFVRKTPDIESVNKLYSDNKEDIDIVVNFLADSEYATIIINDSSGTMSADFQRIDIPDVDIRAVINHLIDEEVVEMFYKTDGDIQVNIYHHKETEYWMARSLYGTIPSVTYATEIIPMNEEGWYFVIANVTDWKIQQK